MSKELTSLEALEKLVNYILLDEEQGYMDEDEADIVRQDKAIIEKELKEKAYIEEELGLPLNVWIFLAKNQLKENPENIYIENTIDDEKQRERGMRVNGRPQRFILWVDFEEKTFHIQGTADEWCHEVPFSDYGKTIALTKEELL